MEGYAKLVASQESEWDRFGSGGRMFPLNMAVQCDSADQAAFKGQRGLAGGTSCNLDMPMNFDDSFEDFHRSATLPEFHYGIGSLINGDTITAQGHSQAAAAYPLAATAHPLAAATHPLAAATHPLAAATHPLAAATHPLAAATHPLAAATRPLAAATHPLAAATHPLAAATRPLAAVTHPLAAARFRPSMTSLEAAAANLESPSVGERARAAWIAIAKKHRGLEASNGQHGVSWSHRDLSALTAQQIMWELLQDPTFDRSYLLHLLFENVRSKFGPPTAEASSAGDELTCKFCRNNNEEDIYHQFKNASGLVVCPVLSKHVCDLCGVSGPFAHTRKYCPKNPLTLGCPEEGGFPPGMLPKDVYETTQMMLQMVNSRK